MPHVIAYTGAGLKVVAYAQASVSTNVIALSIPPGLQPRRVFLSVHTANAGIRWRADGTNPDTSTGHLVTTNSTVEVVGASQISAFRMVRNSTTDCEVGYSLEV